MTTDATGKQEAPRGRARRITTVAAAVEHVFRDPSASSDGARFYRVSVSLP